MLQYIYLENTYTDYDAMRDAMRTNEYRKWKKKNVTRKKKERQETITVCAVL